jgi:ATP-dependent RNA helicase DOB1
VANEDQVSSYYKLRQQLDHLSKELLTYIQKPQYILPFLQPGRLVHVKNGTDDFSWGMIVNFQKKANQSKVSVFVLLFSISEVGLF